MVTKAKALDSSLAKNETVSAVGIAIASSSNTPTNIFFALLGIYVILSVLYLMQREIPKVVRCCFGRRRDKTRRTLSLSESHTSCIQRIFTSCRQTVFAIRILVSDCMHYGYRSDNTYTMYQNQNLDESKYEYWSATQVAAWAYTQLQHQEQRGGDGEHDVTTLLQAQYHNGNSSSNSTSTTIDSFASLYNTMEERYNQQRGITHAVVLLKKQRVDGKSLAHLTLDHMLNFGIKFGVAIRLMGCIDELIPNNRRVNDEEKGGELPSWYETDEGITSSNCERNSIAGQNIEMSEKAQRIMKDRFGMSLPTLRGGDDNGDENEIQSELHSQNERYQGEEMPQSHFLNEHESINTNNVLDSSGNTTSPLMAVDEQQNHDGIKDLLRSMPPHIRAVAERNPDLVATLLREKQQQQQQQSYSQQALSSLPTVSEEDNYQLEEDVNIDSESIGLLRRRTSNR